PSPAGFLASAAAGLIVSAPDGTAIDMLGWVWPPLLLTLLAVTVVPVQRRLHSRTRVLAVYPGLAGYGLCAVGGSYQTIGEWRDRRTYRAPGQLVDVGGHRLHLYCAGSGTPVVILKSGIGEAGAQWGW